MDQATKDYHTSKLDKERLLLYAHLSQQQSIQVLELHGRLAESMDKSRLLSEKVLGDRLKDTNDKLFGQGHSLDYETKPGRHLEYTDQSYEEHYRVRRTRHAGPHGFAKGGPAKCS
jgi:hypothetical protein